MSLSELKFLNGVKGCALRDKIINFNIRQELNMFSFKNKTVLVSFVLMNIKLSGATILNGCGRIVFS